VKNGNVVITPQGLVGTVDKARGSVSRVTLLTDAQSAVTATDLTNPAAVGVVRRGGGGSDVLVFDRVPKAPYVGIGDTVITAGSVSGSLPSLFPHGIPIGTVSSTSGNDINIFQTIQVEPFVNFATLQSVIVLVPKR
jgi:rod shape-determining protein MreC